jgi:hypothetical protein
MLCAVSGVGTEVVGGGATGAGFGRDDLGATLCGVGDQRALSWLCHSRSVDRVTRHGEARVAGGVAAHAAPGAGGGAAPLLCDRLGRSRLVCAVVIPAHRALRLASAVTDQYRRHVSARGQCALSALARVGAPTGDTVGRAGHSVCGAAAAAKLYVTRSLGPWLY